MSDEPEKITTDEKIDKIRRALEAAQKKKGFQEFIAKGGAKRMAEVVRYMMNKDKGQKGT